MKRKFGSYTINAKNIYKQNYREDTIKTKTLLEGDIEIGIEIETMSWRADWLSNFVFGKNASNYRLMSVENNMSLDCTKNEVIATWEKDWRKW